MLPCLVGSGGDLGNTCVLMTNGRVYMKLCPVGLMSLQQGLDLGLSLQVMACSRQGQGN